MTQKYRKLSLDQFRKCAIPLSEARKTRLVCIR
jgi:hypothetical protein